MALRRRTLVALALLTVLASWGVSQHSSAAESALEPLLREGLTYSIPFQPGETLVYEVNWKPVFFFPAFKVGELNLDVKKSTYREKEAFKISALAVSNGALSRVAGLDVRDYFESIIDGESFRSYRVLKQTREGDRKRDVEILFNYNLDQTHVLETDVGLNPPKKIRDEIISGIPGPLTDILSVFYVARLRNLEVGDNYVIYLSDNGKHEKVQVKVQKKEKIGTPIGRFETLKITTVGGLFREGGDFRIWYSQDNLRVPVRFEADVNFGKVYGHLLQMQTEGMVRGRVKTS